MVAVVRGRTGHGEVEGRICSRTRGRCAPLLHTAEVEHVVTVGTRPHRLRAFDLKVAEMWNDWALEGAKSASELLDPKEIITNHIVANHAFISLRIEFLSKRLGHLFNDADQGLMRLKELVADSH